MKALVNHMMVGNIACVTMMVIMIIFLITMMMLSDDDAHRDDPFDFVFNSIISEGGLQV